MTTKIGQFGNGFVGQAVTSYFEQRGIEAVIYDTNPRRRTVETPAELVDRVGNGIIFVAVPTPMNRDGSCALEVVESAMAGLDQAAREQRRRPIAVLKSTVPVGTTSHLQQQYPSLWLCYSPEFLTEAQAHSDFAREEVILCGPQEVTSSVHALFHRADPAKRVVEVERFELGELVKHVRNVTLAVTVSLANEFALFATELGLDYVAVRNLALRDKRLPQSHFNVPGPDGLPGYGGSCFPKDVTSFLTQCAALGVPANVVAGAQATNAIVRPQRDWEQLVGRAVV
jgi:UDPglucose 6-dehydrogenase